jgi:hypothetical protein
MMSRERATRPEPAHERPDLGREYHAIGISAVVAALPYRGKQKNEAYAPSQPKPKDDKRKALTLADLDHLMV